MKKVGAAEKPKATAPLPMPVVVKAGVDSTHSKQVLTATKLAGMNRVEILAVAIDRGYDLGHPVSRGATALAFLKAQDADPKYAEKS